MLTQCYCEFLSGKLLEKAAELRQSAQKACASYEATTSAVDAERISTSSILAMDAFSHDRTAKAFALWPTLSLEGKKDFFLRQRPVLLDEYVPTFESDLFLVQESVRIAA
jgi:hypothetical protein